jgi:hypothetical protein
MYKTQNDPRRGRKASPATPTKLADGFGWQGASPVQRGFTPEEWFLRSHAGFGVYVQSDVVYCKPVLTNLNDRIPK